MLHVHWSATMISTPEVVFSPARCIAFIELQIPHEQIAAAMQAALAEIRQLLDDQHIVSCGPWFTHHARLPSTTFELRLCIPVSAPVQPRGRVQYGQHPAATVARTVYSGNYTGLAAAWGQFRDWIAAGDLTPRRDLWEIYLVGPDASPNPADWRTELNRPLLQ